MVEATDSRTATPLTQAQLEAWGRRIGAEARRPLVLALRGELGAGKSVLARAVARGAGITARMPSPTFNLVFRYQAPDGTEVLHVDLYRLEDPAEVWELGWREIGEGEQIALIEWPCRAGPLLPEDRWDVHLDRVDADRRAVRCRSHGTAPPLPGPP